MEKFSLVLLAGGVGKRMDRDVPKQLLLLAGKPIIIHTLERVERIDEIAEIVIASPKKYIQEIEEIISKYCLNKKITCVEGGATRQESTYKALLNCNKDLNHVIIHEASRPFVLEKEFRELIECQEEACIYGTDIPFTVLEGKEYIEKNLERSRLINIQLPQKFNKNKLIQAHQDATADGKNFTEDASLYFEYTNEQIKVLRGSDYNLKITKPIDLILGESIHKEYVLGIK